MSLPIRGRIALFGAAVVAVTVVLFSVVVYKLVEQSLFDQQYRLLRDRNLAVRGPVVSALLGNRGPFLVPLAISQDTFIEVLDTSGTPLVSTAEINGADPQIPADVLRLARGNRIARAIIEPAPGTRLRVLVREYTVQALPQVRYVVSGQPMSGIEGQLGRLRTFLGGGALLSLVGALAASWLLAGRALRPLEAMTQTAEQIGRTQDLTRRLPTVRARDEVSRLTTSFNEMLQRLQGAYQRLEGALDSQRRFVADASHELRTPLTSIRSNAGLLLQRPDVSPEDRLAALQDIASESERMSRLVQGLLTLARADAGQHLERAPLDLHPLLEEVFRQACKLYPTRTLQLDNGTPARVVANADALKQLLWILIDNAAKYTSDAGHIQIGEAQLADRVEVAVKDDGIGIPPGDLDRIFDRFYQGDPARSGGGTGLGLAIAQWIAREHEGRVVASNNADGGATFRVELPVARWPNS